MKALPLLCRRAAAFLYDSLLVLALFFVVTGAAVYLNDSEPVGGVGFAALLWAVAGAFFVAFWRRGRTLGMQAWQLRVVATGPGAHGERTGASVDARPDAPALGTLAARYALGSALFGVTWAWMVLDRDGLALHDRLSRTALVRDAR